MGQSFVQSGGCKRAYLHFSASSLCIPQVPESLPSPQPGHRAPLLFLLLLLPLPWAPQRDCRTSPARTLVLMLLLSFRARSRVKQDLPETSPKAGSRWLPPHRAAPREAGFSPSASIPLCPPVPVPTRAAMGPRLECLTGGIPRSGQKVPSVDPKTLHPFHQKCLSLLLPHRLTSPPAPLTVTESNYTQFFFIFCFVVFNATDIYFKSLVMLCT